MTKESAARSYDEPRRIAVIGLGYVGLPLACAFGKIYATVGYDMSHGRIAELQGGMDHTGETDAVTLQEAVHLVFSSDPDQLADCNFFVVAVPTPVDEHKVPDLSAVLCATDTVGRVLKRGDIVVYESTVYPGATEEVCVPLLEQASNLHYNKDFFCGYSPERINPGDKEHRLATIRKVVSGSTPTALDVIDAIYSSIVPAGTYRAESIQVAEAAKVIENTQRDVNVALINELAVLFDRMNLDTDAVLRAAQTKWNFLPFKPGLVGGHCIGVDPYYLTYKAQQLGYTPEIILAGRHMNDSMGAYVAHRTLKAMALRGIMITGARVLILGFTFKEDCPDVRNTRVVDIAKELDSMGCDVDIHDPIADAGDARRLYGVELLAQPRLGSYDAVILAVAHATFLRDGAPAPRAYGKENSVLFDVKSALPRAAVDGRL